MNYNDAEKMRAMIAGHWNLRMDDATCDLWLGALLPKDGDISVKTVARLAKTNHHPPRIADFEEVYAMLVNNAALPPAESCSTCAGDLFVFVGLRPAVKTQWMEEHGIDVPASGNMIEEWAPCPDCNPECNTSFPRPDGRVFTSMDPTHVRERMAPAVQQPVPRGAQDLPQDVRGYLRDMSGITGEFAPAEIGACEDCGYNGKRYEYGQFSLCMRCCSRRKSAAEKVSTDELVSVLRDVQ